MYQSDFHLGLEVSYTFSESSNCPKTGRQLQHIMSEEYTGGMCLTLGVIIIYVEWHNINKSHVESRCLLKKYVY